MCSGFTAPPSPAKADDSRGGGSGGATGGTKRKARPGDLTIDVTASKRSRSNSRSTPTGEDASDVVT